MKYYRTLVKGEIIKKGDEIDISVGWNDEPKWIPVIDTIGQLAPDPDKLAHSRYRRLVESPIIETWDDFKQCLDKKFDGKNPEIVHIIVTLPFHIDSLRIEELIDGKVFIETES